MELLQQHGWRLEHVRGSHHILRKQRKHLSVPVHAGRELGIWATEPFAEGGGAQMRRNGKMRAHRTASDGAYYARIIKQRGSYLVEFPDLPGCLTEGESLATALANAREALSGWLFVALTHGDDVPLARAHSGREYHSILPDPDVAVPLAIRTGRRQRGLTPRQVAAALSISLEAYRRLESPRKSNPTLRTLQRLAEILGLELQLKAA